MNIAGKWDGQKVLVTGAGGFFGSHLCQALQRSGADIHGVSRVDRSAESSTIHWWQSDLTDAAAVRACGRRSDPMWSFVFPLSPAQLQTCTWCCQPSAAL